MGPRGQRNPHSVDTLCMPCRLGLLGGPSNLFKQLVKVGGGLLLVQNIHQEVHKNWVEVYKVGVVADLPSDLFEAGSVLLAACDWVEGGSQVNH